MATKLKKFVPRKIGRPNDYPWNDWLNPKEPGAYELRFGVDYHCSRETLIVMVYKRARKRGVAVRVHRGPGPVARKYREHIRRKGKPSRRGETVVIVNNGPVKQAANRPNGRSKKP